MRLSGIQDILRSKESNSKLADSEERLLSVPESQSHTSPDSMSTFKMEESQFFENGQSTLDQDKTQASQVSSSLEMPLLKSLESFKVLTECPLIIMLLFQVYPKFISRNIPAILPHMMTVLSLTLPIHAAQVHKIRFREFLASQVSEFQFLRIICP